MYANVQIFTYFRMIISFFNPVDPRHFQTTVYGSKKTGATRAQFLIESVQCLKSQLREIGTDLLVAHERPDIVIEGKNSHQIMNSQDQIEYIFSQH